ncbi:aspartic ase precursor [Fusarium beomiforme]|uniref:Aspartic ase n=1 Tax=Fusarium beomiforme TaxID=44412 RepID=A0A9P5ABV9_9HYPO|nr:aspartic ase precursor [Fusarium beomiforme]
MSLKLLVIAALAASVNGLSMPPSQGAAFSVNAFTPSTPEEFDSAAERQRLEAKFPTSDGNTKVARSYKQAGSAKVKPRSNGLSFFVPTVIGNQTFQMVYDTGSADLWVYSNESSPFQSLDHPTYVPTSSAKLLSGYTWAIKYAGGQNVSGVVYTDIVKAGPVVARKQAVQAATIIPFEFASDGILGLAPSTINTVKPNKQKTFFETVMPTLERKLFAANLRVDGKPATWDFGYIDNTKYKGKITYTPVTSEKYWAMNVSTYAVGGGPFTNSKKTVGQVLLDSGSALVYLPDAIVKDYYSQIKGYEYQEGGSHTFPCKGPIPDFHFKIDGTTLTFPGRDVNYTTYDPAHGTCVGAISRGGDPEAWFCLTLSDQGESSGRVAHELCFKFQA